MSHLVLVEKTERELVLGIDVQILRVGEKVVLEGVLRVGLESRIEVHLSKLSENDRNGSIDMLIANHAQHEKLIQYKRKLKIRVK